MARETPDLGLIALGGDLAPRDRAKLRRGLEALLHFQRTLRTFPRVHAPDATPIVAVYRRGALAGCASSRAAGSGGARVTRAFLAASAPLDGDARDVAAELLYARRARWIERPSDLAIGTEGIAFVRPGERPVLLMPQVARDHGVDHRGLVRLLSDKARADVERDVEENGARFAAWAVERLAARGDDVEDRSAREAARLGADPADYAAAWIARMIAADGSVAFAVEPRARIVQLRGPYFHLRAATAIAALASHGGHPRLATKARRWLAREVEEALSGGRVEAWPADPLVVAATLALACIAGVGARDRLAEKAARLAKERGHGGPSRDGGAFAWHAAQIALALGARTPKPLWSACVDDLAERPFAPWTVLAARAIGDEVTLRRGAAALVRSIPTSGPHAGGAAATPIPETGLTAIAAHALSGLREHRSARAAAIDFVLARQLLPDRIPAPVDAALALGAFSATPVNDLLRPDIAGHALAALVAGR